MFEQRQGGEDGRGLACVRGAQALWGGSVSLLLDIGIFHMTEAPT